MEFYSLTIPLTVFSERWLNKAKDEFFSQHRLLILPRNVIKVKAALPQRARSKDSRYNGQ